MKRKLLILSVLAICIATLAAGTLAYFTSEGKAHKPFVLPQSDPEKDDLTLKSYNIPDLSATPVPFDASSIKRINRQLKAEEFK